MSAGRRGGRLLLVLLNEPTIEDTTLDFAFGPITDVGPVGIPSDPS